MLKLDTGGRTIRVVKDQLARLDDPPHWMRGPHGAAAVIAKGM